MATGNLRLRLEQNNSSDEEKVDKFFPAGSLGIPNIENLKFGTSSQEPSENENYLDREQEYCDFQNQYEELEQYEDQENERNNYELQIGKQVLNLDDIIEYQEVEVEDKQSPVVANNKKFELITIQQDQPKSKNQKKFKLDNNNFEQNSDHDIVQEELGIDIAEAETLNMPQSNAFYQDTPEFTKAVPVPPTSKLKGKSFQFPSSGVGLSQKAKNFSKALDNKKDAKIQLSIPSRDQFQQQEVQSKQLVIQEEQSHEESPVNKTVSAQSEQHSQTSEHRLTYQAQQFNSDQNIQRSFENLLDKFNKNDITPSYDLPYNPSTDIIYTQPMSDQQDFSNSNTRSVHDKVAELKSELKALKSQNQKLRTQLAEQEQQEIVKSQNVSLSSDTSQLEDFKCQARRLQAVLKEKEQKLNFAKTQQKVSTKELQNLYYDLSTVKEAIEEIIPPDSNQTQSIPRCIKNDITQKIYSGILNLRNTQFSQKSKWFQLEQEKQQLQNEIQNAKETLKQQASEHINLIVQLNSRIREKEQEIDSLQTKNSRLQGKSGHIQQLEDEINHLKQHFHSTQQFNQQAQTNYSPNQSQSNVPSLMSTEALSARVNSPFNSIQQDSSYHQKARSKFLRDLEQRTQNLTTALQNLQTTKYKDMPQTQQFQEISPNTTRVRRVVSVSPGSARRPIPKAADQHRRQVSSDMNQEIIKPQNGNKNEEQKMAEAKKLYPHTYRLSPRLARELALEDMKRKYAKY